VLKFPSIDGFRHVIAHVRKQCDYYGIEYPTITYKAVVKLHGTNASIRFTSDGLEAFSRERQLSIGSDNAGFCAWVTSNPNNMVINTVKHYCLMFTESVDGCVVFGEWVGRGVQKNVAVSESDKHFVPFWVAIPTADPEKYDWVRFRGDRFIGIPVELDEKVVIDFNKPDESLAQLNDIVERFENECPYSKLVLDVSGVGEGAVLNPVAGVPSIFDVDPFSLVFKIKGEKHGNKSVKTSAPVSMSAEAAASIDELVKVVLPDWRLEQGLTSVAVDGTVTTSQTGDFIKWIVGDVYKENSDIIAKTIIETGLNDKKINAEIIKIAKMWFMKRVR